ncbi:Ti-type conjugative transfer relaxase TraA [Phenylobacterium immobile]|uniref:Ti-type conjugative transfer relaxase TraA n=1 Tax=Phenylobacterium immobile TaxID=21 RepID=UPI000AB93444|nr:Ti-type conjugative transfer relaxase TraA [Phenylobacterium immobile]
MAIYHFSAKVISRANGSSAVAAAAYRSASRLEDERLGRGHDFTNKAGVVHSEVLAPEGSPERWQDRETLWNEVEALEKRKDAQLAREIEFAIPREMSQAQGVELARDFVQTEFVDRGMVADLNVHWDVGPDGLAKPHAHVMLSMREVTRDGAGPEGFGKKVREWNSAELLSDWRERWAGHVNERLAELGIDAQVDHRSLAAQGIELEPQHKIGPAGMRREGRGEDAERALEHREIARRNGEKIIAEPGVALDAITRQQSTFTDHDLARFVHRHTDDPDQFTEALSAVKTSPELVALGQDGRGRDRYTTREMLETEARLERSAGELADRRGHGVSPAARGDALAAGERRGLRLGGEQRDALEHITGGQDLSMVVGYAGSGKSAMLGVAREAWEAGGYQVRGAALSGIAAESLEAGSSIPSRTIASLEHGWTQGRDALTARDVLVIDEAGMIGSRQMERVLSAADAAGAKVVLVGDAEQLQAIEAGAAFRALTERHGAAEITEIRRQRQDWQREATRELATGRTGAALDRYEAAGMVRGHETREAARSALVDGWDAARQAKPEASQVMLAHTRADVAELNQLARGRMRDAGALGEDHVIQTERGERTFAAGDQIMFLRNERSLGVKNGTLGTVERIDGPSLTVRLDGADRREVRFDLKDYAQIDHGYASTIHKSQGVTVDHGHLLASDGLDRHAAYVGMSRHRETLAVHYGADDFKDRDQLVRTLGRERAKDTTLDYGKAFAERRGLVRSEILVERGPTPVGRAPKRSMFDGLKLGRGGGPAAGITEAAERAAPGPDAALQRGVTRYTAAWTDAERMGEQGLPIMPHQRVEMQKAREGLEGVSREATADLRSALSRNPGLARQGATPEGMKAVQRAMATERTVRLDPAARAERFVEDWRELQAKRAELGVGYQTAAARKAIEGRMKAMADGLGRDAQVESILRGKKLELGLGKVRDMPGVSMGDALVRSLTLGRSIGLGR